MSGQTIAVGAKSAHTSMGQFTGAVYVFDLVDGQWIETQEVVAPDASFGHEFGDAVDVDQNRLIVGAWAHDGMAFRAGSAYIYRRDTNEQWVFEDQLFASNAHEGGTFGDNVAIDGVWAAVLGSGHFEDLDGDLYLFQFDEVEQRWIERQRFPIANTNQHLYNERALSLQGGLLAFGLPLDSAVHVFQLTGEEWVLEQTLDWDGDQFGLSTAVKDGRVFVSAPSADGNEPESGAVHVFDHDGALWTLAATLYHSDGATTGDAFGSSIAVTADSLISGAVGDDELGASAGAAFVFDLECGEFAILNSISVLFGQHLAGGINRIVESDDLYFRSRSNPGFTATEANLIELRINATSNAATPNTLDLIIEGRINQPGGTTRVRLRDWKTGGGGGGQQFDTVHTWFIGMQEETEFIENVPDAADYVRTSDGRVQLSLRQSVFATFSVQGFDSFLDFVSIEVEE